MKTKVYGEGIRRQSFPVIFGTVVLLALGLLLLSGTGAQADVYQIGETNSYATWTDLTGSWDTGANWTNRATSMDYTNAARTLGTNNLISYGLGVPPAHAVVYLTNSLGSDYTVSYNTALYTNNETALRALIMTNGIGTATILNINAKLFIDSTGWVGMSNWWSPLSIKAATVYVNEGGWLDVQATNINASSTEIGARRNPGGLVVVNGGTFNMINRSGAVTDVGAGEGRGTDAGGGIVLSNGFLSINSPRIGRYGAPNAKIEIFDGTAIIGAFSGDNSNTAPGTNWDTAGLIVHGGTLMVSNSITLGSRGWSTMYVTGGSVSNLGTGTAFVLGWLGGRSTNVAAEAKTGGRYVQTGGTVVVPSAAIQLGMLSNNVGDVVVTGGRLEAYGITMNPSTHMGVQASLTITNTGAVYLGGGGLIAYGNTSLYTTNTVTLGDSAVLGARATWYDYYGAGGTPIGINLIRGMPTINAADASGTAYNIDLSAALVGAGGLTKSGGGILTLWAAANTYSGETRIDEGTLAIAGTIDNTPTITIASGAALDLNNVGALTLQSGQTLKGNGTVQGGLVTVLSGATVAPGESVGTLTVSGDLTLQGDLDVEVDRTAVAADLLAVSGTLDISDAGSTVTFNWSGDPDTNAYVFATYGALNGTFAVNNLPDGYYIDYNYLSASQMAVIPEPSTWMLAGLGLLGAYLVRRRTRK